MFGVFGAVLSDVVGVPWGFVSSLDSGLELFGSVDFGVVNPLFLCEVVMVGADEVFPEIEGGDFLIGELAGEDIEVFASLDRMYTRESMLAKNRLLFRYNSLAKSSLAPLLRPVNK